MSCNVIKIAAIGDIVLGFTLQPCLMASYVIDKEVAGKNGIPILREGAYFSFIQRMVLFLKLPCSSCSCNCK